MSYELDRARNVASDVGRLAQAVGSIIYWRALEVFALVRDIPKPDRLLMGLVSLVVNMARRPKTSIETAREVAVLRDGGYPPLCALHPQCKPSDRRPLPGHRRASRLRLV